MSKFSENFMLILAIETSCDETAAAVIRAENDDLIPLSSIVSSQVKLHAKWGGVVPNLAAREHLKNIVPVIEKSLSDAGVGMNDIDHLAVTEGPGLIPALLVGVNAAKTLSYLWKKPLIGIHHIEGHIYANFLGEKIGVSTKHQKTNPKQISNENVNSKLNQNSKFKIQNSSIGFPLLCLVVSGGHTQLVLMKKHLDYEIVGQTIDDAAGEAFDKVARILGLDYPGGPAIAAAAANFQFSISNFQSISNDESSKFKKNMHGIELPRPMINSKDFNFSFSGLKTAVLYAVKKNEKLLKNKSFIAEMSHEFQQAVMDVLVRKTIAAAEKYNPKTIIISGGVSANSELRKQLGEAVKSALPYTTYQIPDTKYSMDNAAMIAAAAYFRISNTKKKLSKDNWKNVQADANMKLTAKPSS